ncbi:MAG: hypothetical protein Q9180_003025 [Flavoplaca navasiana]
MQSPAKVFRYAEFDVNALCELASNLRGGQDCHCNPCQVPKCGSFNWAVRLSFTDGLEWLLRSPLQGYGYLSEYTSGLLLASEAATLRYIRAYSTVPVPEVFACKQVILKPPYGTHLRARSPSKDNEIGIPYMLQSIAPGTPLEDTWKNPGADEPGITHADKMKVVTQLGTITWQLSQLRFAQAGSLFEEDGEFRIKTCLSRGMVLNERDELEDIPRGPFTSEQSFFEGHLLAFLQHVRYLPLGYHCLLAPIPAPKEYTDPSQCRMAANWWHEFVAMDSKIDSSYNRADYVIVGEALLGMVTKWTSMLSDKLPEHSQKPFVLHHPDLSVNNVFVDKDFNVTCIIDWSFCSSVPITMLLTAPGLPQSRDELDRTLVASFESGFRKALVECVQPDDCIIKDTLTEILSRSRLTWLFTRIITFDSTADYTLFHDIWESLGPPEQDLSEYLRSMQASDKYITLHAELARDDPTEAQVAAEEAEFLSKNVEKRAIARKLTLVSEWSSRYRKADDKGLRRNGKVFVADRRLWQWIYDCLKTEHVD